MDIEILRDIIIIFALSTFVNFLFTKIKVPTLLGYMLTGIVAGPYLLGLIHSPHQIELMAEIGVILLMFTIGLEFSLKHLLKIRRIVFLGGFIQFALTALVILFVSKAYGIEWKGALFLGFLTALSSTAVVLKLLQERSEITSDYGRTVLGILIFQDIILVPLLLFTPILGGAESNLSNQLVYLGLKAVLIMAIVYAGNRWIMPRVLHAIALTRNQELFLMSILLICLAIAFLTSELGLSLAFGAFLAGLMISESEYSHDAFGNLIPFKDTFTSFFFVSIGMLLDLNFVMANIALIVFTVLLVLLVKTIIAGGTAFLMGHAFKGTVMVGLALSQVGEFSFILIRLGLEHDIISNYYYQLFLAVAIISMSTSPFLIKISSPIANQLLRLPIPKFLIDGLFPFKQIEVPKLRNHLVIIGKDTRALNLSVMARHMNIPYVSIVYDPATVRKRQEKGESVIYGDALNQSILLKAHADTAEIIVVSIGNLITSMAVVEQLREMNKHANIIVRSKQVEDIDRLYTLGANQVIPEEFETAIDLFERILAKFLVPRSDIEGAVAQIRDDHYGIFLKEEDKGKQSVLDELPNLEISAYRVGPNSDLIGPSFKELQLRSKFEVTVVAVKRNDELIVNPDAGFGFEPNDIAYLLGKPNKIALVGEIFSAN